MIVQTMFFTFILFLQRREKLQISLENDIHTIIHYPIAPHQQKCYSNVEWYKGNFPITEQIHREELSLPLNQSLKEDEIDYIIKTVNSF